MGEKIFVLGGDLRLFYAFKALLANGFEVSSSGGIENPPMTRNEILNSVSECDVLLLGVPASKDLKTVNAPFCNDTVLLSEISDAAGSDKTVICGGSLENVFPCKCVDYQKRDDFAYYNAVPTAEGVLEIAIRETDITVSNSKCLVIGYGRIGKVIANMFARLGTQVTVSARKMSDMAQISAMGYRAVNTLSLAQYAGEFDIIVNTVPHRIIDKKVLERIPQGTLIIDTASKPGGVDMDEAGRLGVNVIWALALPGKVAPKTAGEIICTTVQNILEELRE